MLILSCQRKAESSNDNESKKTAVLEDVISDHNTATLDLLQQIAIKSIEGYHMDSSTIVKLIVEDEIVKIQTLFWENDTVKYSEKEKTNEYHFFYKK